MRVGWKLAGMVALLTASDLNAQSLVPMAIGGVIRGQNGPGMPGHWVYDTNADYAVWDASSSTVAGSEVSYIGKSLAIDQAPLVPEVLYETDQDLIADGKVWLPKGGILIKMIGGENGGNWFCTWRFGQIALANSAEFPNGEKEFPVYPLDVRNG